MQSENHAERGAAEAEREAPQNAFFRAWAEVVLRHRLWILPLLLIATAGFAHQVATGLKIDTSTAGLLHKGAPAAETLDRLHETFGEDRVLMLQVTGDVFSMAFLERLRKMQEQIENLQVELVPLEGELDLQPLSAGADTRNAGNADVAPSSDPGSGSASVEDDFGSFGEEDDGWGDEASGSLFEEMTSLVNVRRTEGTAGGLEVGGLLDEWPSETDLPALRKKVLGDVNLVGQVVDARGRNAALVLRTGLIGEHNSSLVFTAVREVTGEYSRDGFFVRIVGQPVLESYLASSIKREAPFVFGLAMLVILLFLARTFRHPIGVIGPLLAVIQAVVWTLGAMAIMETPVTPVTNILNSFLLCVGIGDNVHIQSVYRDLRRRGLDNHEAIVTALATTGMPVLFTTLTTMLGLLSFRAADLGSIQDLGNYGALGVAYALFFAVVFLPIMLSFNKTSLLGSKPHTEGDRLDRLLAVMNCISRHKATLPAAVVFTLLAGVGMTQMTYFHDPLEWFPEKLHLASDVRDVDANLGGSSSISLLVSAPEGKTLKDRALWQKLERVIDDVKAFRAKDGEPLVSTSLSALNVLKESWRAVHEGDDQFYTLPDTERGVVDMFTLFQSAGPEDLKRLMTLDSRHAHILFRVRWQDASAYGPLTEQISASVREHVGDAATVEPTGAAYVAFAVVDSLIADLIRSFGTALVVITLMMILLLRDLKLGLVSMIPNLMPIVATLGFMGFVDMPLDVGNIMVASIAIGIAVDDTIHFLHQFYSHYQAHGHVEDALSHAFNHTGRAVITTSVLLAGGFVMFLFGDMHHVQRFGSLVALSVVFALLADLLIAPAVLRRVYKDRPA